MGLTQDQEALEHEIKVEQMRADILNKMADTELKREQRRWEPWKMLLTAAIASAAVVGSITGVVGYFVGSLSRGGS